MMLTTKKKKRHPYWSWKEYTMAYLIIKINVGKYTFKILQNMHNLRREKVLCKFKRVFESVPNSLVDLVSEANEGVKTEPWTKLPWIGLLARQRRERDTTFRISLRWWRPHWCAVFFSSFFFLCGIYPHKLQCHKPFPVHFSYRGRYFRWKKMLAFAVCLHNADKENEYLYCCLTSLIE